MSCTEKKKISEIGINEECLQNLQLIAKGMVIEKEESRIDKGADLYLITWCPDPAELPNSDFNIQHLFNINLLADYLKTVKCGLFCVESTQLGNPHYHGWYQKEPCYELPRIAIMKTLQRFGRVKVTKAKSVKPGLYSERSNGLHYYKKEVMDEMINVSENPITSRSKCDYPFYSSYFFTMDSKKPTNMEDKLSDRQFYLQFYTDST